MCSLIVFSFKEISSAILECTKTIVYKTICGKEKGAGEEGEGRIAHVWPEFLLCSGQADMGGLPDTFHSAPGGHLSH